jgi:hypothetical protein
MLIHHLLRHRFPSFAMILLALALGPPQAIAASSVTAFRAVSPEELKMTSEPEAPGASAIILYREVVRNDGLGSEEDYYRIKVLTDEGRKYADVEIPYYKGEEKITGINGRTIKPDGSIVDFDGNVTTKTVVKARGLRYLAKTFTLPGVQAGCVIEYFYKVEFFYVFGSQWVISNELFTKVADFVLYPNPRFPGHSIWHNMPPDTSPPHLQKDGSVQLELSNIPAFQTEDFMPPENEVTSRVEFSYAKTNDDRSPEKYWNDFGKVYYTYLEDALEKSKILSQAAREIVKPEDPPEVKLQKLYARVQTLRNTSFEEEKTQQEQHREKQKAAKSLDDVWKRGYGQGGDITWVYLALVKAAGFDAHAVLVPNRSRDFFYPKLREGDRLNTGVVLIKLNGKDAWGDPGWAFTPFGLLPWPETQVDGLLLDKGGPTWVKTMASTSAQARTERHAALTLSDSGDLAGTVKITFGGLEGARMRVDEDSADDIERKTVLEDLVKSYVPMPAEVKLTNLPDWKSSAVPLTAEFSIKIPGWGSVAGRRLILPSGIFSAAEKHLFDHAGRIYQVYVAYPYAESDDITIQIPSRWKIATLPNGWHDNNPALTYTFIPSNDSGNLHLSRSLTMDFMFVAAEDYSALRSHFQQIKSADDQQAVLESGGAAAK